MNVLGYANAIGMHKCKLAVIVKSCVLSVFEEWISYQYIIMLTKKAQITKAIFSHWFHKPLFSVPCTYCWENGLDENSQILFFLENFSSPPPAIILIKHNVYSMYCPPNMTSLIQPSDQGILRSMKSIYRVYIYCNVHIYIHRHTQSTFLNNTLTAVNEYVGGCGRFSGVVYHEGRHIFCFQCLGTQ